jgi:hypothetical protein
MEGFVRDFNTLVAGAVLGGSVASCWFGMASRPTPPSGQM